MQPVVISRTIQELSGVRYYLCGKYFQRKGIRLHRKVWEFHKGPIPKGRHVHHRFSRARNRISELECLTVPEHFGGRHGAEYRRRGRKLIRKATLAAPKWHRSPAGRQWHREHGKRVAIKNNRNRVWLRCKECKTKFSTPRHCRSWTKFCSPVCRQRDLRKRRKISR